MFELRFEGRTLARGSEMRMRAERIVTAQFHGRLTRDYQIVKVWMSDPHAKVWLTEKGNTMLKKAIITSVCNGVEYTDEVEDVDLMVFYAKVVGFVKGSTNAGYQITKVEEVQ